MVAPVARSKPWMVSAGNHEIERDDRPPGTFDPMAAAGRGEPVYSSFSAFQHRFAALRATFLKHNPIA